MLNIEQNISPLVENLFPEFYKTEGQNFIAFIKEYYSWLEQNFQWLEVTSIEGFTEGDVLTQVQSNDTTATGTLYHIDEDGYFLVQLTTFDTFRCRHRCNVLAPLINQDGIETVIIEQTKVNPIFGARNLFKYRDVDETIDSFILYFKEKYLKNIQFNTATNKQLLIKNSLDLYRSKGTERGVDLFFKLVYDKNAQVYYPGDDVFKLSDGDWYVPQYLEITQSDRAIDFVGKIVTGLSSGAYAFVEKFIKRKIATGYIYLIYISNVTGSFETGEILKTDAVYSNSPKVLGSLHELTVINPGSGYTVGDIVDVIDEYGQFGKARVVSTTTSTGEVEFLFYSGGYGYSITPIEYLSDKIITISNVNTTDTQYFRDFDNFTQKLANLTLSSITSNAISEGANVYSYYPNNDVRALGKVLERTFSSIVGITVNTAANSTTLLSITSGNTGYISVGDMVVGSTNTAVVNTNNSAKVTAIVNSTAFEVNADIIIANGTASVATSSTSDVGEIFVYVLEGEFTNSNIYTESNTISGQIENVLDKTISAKIIKANELNLAISNATGTFTVGMNVIQSNGTATIAGGTISELSVSGGSGYLILDPYYGILDSSYAIESEDSSSSANLDSFTTTLAVQFNKEKNVEVTVNTAANSTTLLVFTAGNTSGMQPGDLVYASSNTSVVNTNIEAEISSIVNSSAVIVNSDIVQSNGVATVTFYDITDNDFVTNTSVFANTSESNTSFVIDSVSLGSGAEYALVNVETSETVFINTDLIGGNNVSNVPFLSIGLDALEYGFNKDAQANLSSYLIEALEFSLMTIGSITDVITANPGSDYTLAPVAVVVEPAVAALNLQDYILEVEETPGTFQIGDVITQNVANLTLVTLDVANADPFIVGEIVYQGSNLASSTANGIVYVCNTAADKLVLINSQGTWSAAANVLSYITANNEDVTAVNTGTFTAEVARGEITQTILGSNSTTLYVTRKSLPSFILSGNTIQNEANFTANILSIDIQYESIPIGLNANVEANVIISTGAVSELEVIDSGFGYPNSAIVTFSGNSSQTNGTARALVDDYGRGEGRYRSTKGFLSEDKYIFDGDYYQEYSYEIMSSFSFDKYSDIFKKVMHVAGTNLFGSVVLQDTGNVAIVSDNVTISQS